jgi:hypothetical protein
LEPDPVNTGVGKLTHLTGLVYITARTAR